MNDDAGADASVVLPYAAEALQLEVFRQEATIRSIEARVDASGRVLRLSTEVHFDEVEAHGQIRVTIMGIGGVHYDEILPVHSRGWNDIAASAAGEDRPLPGEGVHWPGTQIRVAPYAKGKALQSKAMLALQGPLDAIPGEGRYVHGGWSAEWPGSLWKSASVLGRGGEVLRVFALADGGLDPVEVYWRTYRVGYRDEPLAGGRLADSLGGVLWATDDWTCIDLTADFAQVGWADLHEAVLEFATIPVGDELTSETKWLHIPITAR